MTFYNVKWKGEIFFQGVPANSKEEAEDKVQSVMGSMATIIIGEVVFVGEEKEETDFEKGDLFPCEKCGTAYDHFEMSHCPNCDL